MAEIGIYPDYHPLALDTVKFNSIIGDFHFHTDVRIQHTTFYQSNIELAVSTAQIIKTLERV